METYFGFRCMIENAMNQECQFFDRKIRDRKRGTVKRETGAIPVRSRHCDKGVQIR